MVGKVVTGVAPHHHGRLRFFLLGSFTWIFLTMIFGRGGGRVVVLRVVVVGANVVAVSLKA